MHKNHLEFSTDILPLSQAVGYVVINWAIAELSLDMCVSMIFHECANSKEIEPKIPRSLSKKMRFVRRALGKLDEIKSFQNEGLLILEKMTALIPKRHNVVHGAVTTITATNGIFQLTTLDYTDDSHIIKDAEFDISQFPKLADDLLDLVTLMSGFSISLAKHFELMKE